MCFFVAGGDFPSEERPSLHQNPRSLEFIVQIRRGTQLQSSHSGEGKEKWDFQSCHSVYSDNEN